MFADRNGLSKLASSLSPDCTVVVYIPRTLICLSTERIPGPWRPLPPAFTGVGRVRIGNLFLVPSVPTSLADAWRFGSWQATSLVPENICRMQDTSTRVLLCHARKVLNVHGAGCGVLDVGLVRTVQSVFWLISLGACIGVAATWEPYQLHVRTLQATTRTSV